MIGHGKSGSAKLTPQFIQQTISLIWRIAVML
jgi:hypothetical protein